MAPMALPVPERAVLLANQRLDPAVCTGDPMTRAAISSFDVKWGALRKRCSSGLPTSVENATAPLWVLHGYLRQRKAVYLYGTLWLRGLVHHRYRGPVW
jgi:hypothetical protein